MLPIKRIQIEPDCLEPDCLKDAAAGTIEELQCMGIEVLIADEETDRPAETLYVTGSKEGILHARNRGMIPILLMFDPDEAMKLTAHEPAGGIVSLLELPDFIRVLRAQATRLPSP